MVMDQGYFFLKKLSGLLLFLLFLAACSNNPGRTENGQAIFHKALLFYEKGQFDQAIAQYTLLLDKGLESGPLYYDLGNCYLQRDQPGKAILYYERAKRFFPSDRDLLANYQYAKSRLRSGPEPSRAWYQKSVDDLFRWTSIDGVALLLSGIYISFLLILIASWYIPPVRRYMIHFLFVLGVIFVLASISLHHRISSHGNEAVITEDMAEAKFQPFDRAPAHFILQEGMKVKVLSWKDEWAKIERSDKKVGWVRRSKMEVI